MSLCANSGHQNWPALLSAQQYRQLGDVARNPSSRVSKLGLRIARPDSLIESFGFSFCFYEYEKFSRAFDEPALSSCSFFASCSLIAKAVDFSARHLGCFAFGILAELTGGGSVSARFFIHEN